MDSKPEPAVTQELAQIAEGRDVTRGYVDPRGLLPIADSILRERGGSDYKIYEEVLRDDQVFSTFQQRRLSVIAQPWEVVPGGDAPIDMEAAESLKENLKRLNFDESTNKMLFGFMFGFSVAECMWRIDGERVELQALRVRKQRRFRWGADSRLRLLTTNAPLGELMPERKFWTFATGADNDDEPYGMGLAHWLYWPCFFKRFDVKIWIMFLEKFGLPTVVGKHPAGASEAEKKALLAAAIALQSDAAVTIPDSMMINLLEAARSGSADQSVFYDKMNAAIAKVVLTQTMTTDDGASLSQASVHSDKGNLVSKSDADLLCESFNQGPARWLTEWNYPGAKIPQVWRQMPTDGKLAARAELEAKVVSMGVARPTLQHIQDTYDGEWELIPAGVTPFLGAPMPTSSTEMPDVQRDTPVAAPVEDVAQGALNGAQVSSLVEVVQAVASGQLPRDSATEIVKVAFKLDDAGADRVLGKAGKGFKIATSEFAERLRRWGSGLKWWGRDTSERPRTNTLRFAAVEEAEDVATQLAAQVDDATGEVMDAMIGSIKNAIVGAESWADMSARLEALKDSEELDPTTLTGILQSALANANLTGRTEVNDETRDKPRG